jgi:putative ABC transport system permease protein
MHSLVQDLRYGMRGLRKQPGFVALTVVALALGIGAATVMFSVIDAVLLHPQPYVDAERVVQIHIHDVTEKEWGGRAGFTVPEFLDYQEQNQVFDEVIGGGWEPVRYAGAEGAEHYNGVYLTPNTFRRIGMPALLGRTMVPDDAKPGAPPVFVMSYKMWSKRFNLDRAILGRTFVLNGTPRTLVGIMPPRFDKLDGELWLPALLNRSDPDAKNRWYFLQAHLKPGVTLSQAEADLEVLAHRLAQVYPKQYPKKFTVQLDTVYGWLLGRFRTPLYTLMGAVGLLLLIACSNVANMLLARATAREKEMAIRGSLGASRARLVRQLLVESLLLALASAVVGCVLAYGGIKALVAVIPEGWIPGGVEIGLNAAVLAFSLGAAVVTALVFGLAPALQTARRDMAEPLKDSGKGVSGGFRHGRLRAALVVMEVAVSMVLLVGAGLLMRTFMALEHVELGMNADNLLVGWAAFPQDQYKSAGAKQHFFRPLLQRLTALPGVVSATEITSYPPWAGGDSEIEIGGKTHSEKWSAVLEACSEGYFSTLRIRLVRGRVFSEAEADGARKLAIVNQTLVGKYFGKEDPIGRQIELKDLKTLPDPVEVPVFEIIGVVGDTKNRGLQEQPLPEAFVPYTISGSFDRGVMLRSSGDPLALANSLRREVWAIDRNVALTDVGSLQGFFKQWLYAQQRFSFILLSIFAGLGLVLVAIGTYSVIAYTVSRQTHEIGIRMALGASGPDVLAMVLRVGVRLIGLGMMVGLAGCFGVTRVIASQLWGVSPYDPVTLGVVAAVVAISGLSACYFPARHATRVDPMVALRYE